MPGTGETVITEFDNDQLICLDPPNAVGKMTLSPANTTVFAGGRSFRPVGLVYEPRNELVFCVDGTGGEIWQIDVRANTIGQAYNNYGSAPGQLMNPTGIELVAGEFPAVSDWGTNRVTIFQL